MRFLYSFTIRPLGILAIVYFCFVNISYAGSIKRTTSFTISYVSLGVAADQHGFIYATDAGGDCVRKYDQKGNYITSFGKPDSPGGLDFPTAINIDSADNVYVYDALNGQLKVFNTKGQFLRNIGSYGYNNDQYLHVTKIAFDSINNVYVADGSSSKIVKYSPDGTYIRHWGRPGTGNYEFLNISGLAIDHNDVVYVSDIGKDAVNYIKTYTTNGFFRSAWNNNYECPIPFSSGYCSTGTNDLTISDGYLFAISGYIYQRNLQQKLINTIGYKDGFITSHLDEIFAKNGYLYVLSTTNDMVQVFKYSSNLSSIPAIMSIVE